MTRHVYDALHYLRFAVFLPFLAIVLVLEVLHST
jgi:hypothetical protein